MQISRRGALIGAGAAAVAAGVPGAVQANSDPQIEALLDQLRAADALYDDNSARYDAATSLIPRAVKKAVKAVDDHPRQIGDSQAIAAMKEYNRHLEACGAKALAEQSEPILDRISDIQAQLIQTPAKTLRGTLSKARIFWNITAIHEGFDETDPNLDAGCCRLDDPQFIWSMLQDLERLAGEARS